MKKCTVQDKRTYYCFEEDLSEELEPLIDLVENYSLSIPLLRGAERSEAGWIVKEEQGSCEDNSTSSCSLQSQSTPQRGELKEGGQPSKEISLSNENSPLEGGVAESDGGGENNSKWTITTIYSGRNRLLRVRKGDYDLVIKCFAVPNALRGLYYGWGRNSKAKRSFQNSLYLEELEIGVAKPRAFVEEHSRFGVLKRSYYIADWIDYTKNNIHCEMRGWSNPNGLLPALAQFIAGLHELGIEHRDLSPGNILYKYNRETGTYDFSLVDVNRMKSYPFALSTSLSLKNLERLASNYSVSSQLAYYYAEARGLDRTKTIERVNKLCDDFWLWRLKKLSVRALKKEKGLGLWDVTKLNWAYKWLRLRRKLTSDAGKKAELYLKEEELYRKYFSLEDIRHALRKKEHYSYRIENSSQN